MSPASTAPGVSTQEAAQTLLSREVEIPGLTPTGAYARLCDQSLPGFLLESALGDRRLGRYSYVGFQPRPLELGEGDPLPALAAISDQALSARADRPRFAGGAVGYLGWEAARHFERLPLAERPAPPLPESAFLVADAMAAFDHLTGRLLLLAVHRPGVEPRAAAEARLDELQSRLAEPAPTVMRAAGNGAGWQANVTRERFLQMVQAAREHVLAGDAFQVVLSLRFSRPLSAPPLDVYRCLRHINPSPYMYLLSLGKGRHLVGTSPELLVRAEGDWVETRPLAGTRPRGEDPARDLQLELELLADPKERAEHVMLVDLGRNDLGRVAVPGTVRVERLMEVERYSHVMHMSSTVAARLAPGRTSLDALRATFPAGTLSGAPKIRAMEIIAALEPERRGPYGGAVGYVGFGGDLDMAITLRTIVIADGRAYVQAGAGIVADSEPEREYEEALSKARAMFAAIERAEALS
jgi:anthranilate synthase component 1